MSSFTFPHEVARYLQIKNAYNLQQKLKEDASLNRQLLTNCFKIKIVKRYGYTAIIEAYCKYCDAKIKYKSRKDKRDEEDSCYEGTEYNKQTVHQLSFRLVMFRNNHNHTREKVAFEINKSREIERKRSVQKRYETLVSQNLTSYQIRAELKKSMRLNNLEVRKYIKPVDELKRIYCKYKEEMKEMGFEIIEKYTDMIDLSKFELMKANLIEFPNELTVFTPEMKANYEKYGRIAYFGLHPEYFPKAKRLLLTGGFYAINHHHEFVPLAFTLFSIVRQEQQMQQYIQKVDEYLEKEDEELMRVISSVIETFIVEYESKSREKVELLVMRHNLSTQNAALALMRQFKYMKVAYCHKEKLRHLEIEINRRYLNDSTSLIEKTAFNEKLGQLIRTYDNEQFEFIYGQLLKKANTNNTLLLQKLMEDSSLFCFNKITSNMNNLSEKCIDDYLRDRYCELFDRAIKSQLFLKNALKVIKKLVLEEKNRQYNTTLTIDECSQCWLHQNRMKSEPFNETQLLQARYPQLKSFKGEVCIKTYQLLIKNMIKSIRFKSVLTSNKYREQEYLVVVPDYVYKVVLDAAGRLKCSCGFSSKLGVPCPHQMFVCLEGKLDLKVQLNNWLLD